MTALWGLKTLWGTKLDGMKFTLAYSFGLLQIAAHHKQEKQNNG